MTHVLVYKICKYCERGFWTTDDNTCDECKEDIADIKANEKLVEE